MSDEITRREIYAAIKGARLDILEAVTASQRASHEQAKRTRELVRERFHALVVEQFDEIITQLERITTPVINVHRIMVVISGQSIHVPGLRAFQGEDMSYTVPRDHANEPFTLDPITASDSEGPVTVEFTERLESSDESVVAISGSEFVFGTFGGATVNRIVTFDGNDFIIASVVFNVTPGAISFTGNIDVPGLTADV